MRFLHRALNHAPPSPPWDNRDAIREELFGVERLEEHGRSLAAAQAVGRKATRGHALSRRLADNADVLFRAHQTIAAAITADQAITPAAEWLVDNYHLVERQIREIRSDLPPGFYRQLPKLADGPFAGYPRVLGVAWAFVAHTDSRFDHEMLCRYVAAYQEVQPLTIGELWAMAITLRIVLVENLRRIAARIVASSDARKEADSLVDRLLESKGRAAVPATTVLADYERGPLPGALSVQLLHRLHDSDPRAFPALTWLTARLAAQGTSADEVVNDEHQKQGAATVTVRNIITSMRLISDVDWTELFERMSLVDKVLTEGTRFAEFDFSTRNLYRSAIESLARRSRLSEIEIAQRVLVAAARSREAAAGADADRLGDPGYHLISGGRRSFEAEVGFQPPLRTRLANLNRGLGIAGYGSAIVAVALALLVLPLPLREPGLAGCGWLSSVCWEWFRLSMRQSRS